MRNEAAPDRYLQRALDNAALFCDAIVVVDDHSTDATHKICQAHRKVVSVTKTSSPHPTGSPQVGWWVEGSEGGARRQLWEQAARSAKGDWIYVFDADHELLGITPAEFRQLLKSPTVDAWACPLWDCWDSDVQHRVDGYWQAWRSPRPWLFRALPGEWNVRGIHAGHAPLRNWNVGLMPFGAGIAHYGYVKLEHRLTKRERYLHVTG